MSGCHDPREVVAVVLDVLLDLVQDDTTEPAQKIAAARLLHEVVLRSSALIVPGSQGGYVTETAGAEESGAGV